MKRPALSVACPRCGAKPFEKCWKIEQPGRPPVQEPGHTQEIHIARVRTWNSGKMIAVKPAKVMKPRKASVESQLRSRIKELEATNERLALEIQRLQGDGGR